MSAPENRLHSAKIAIFFSQKRRARTISSVREIGSNAIEHFVSHVSESVSSSTTKLNPMFDPKPPCARKNPRLETRALILAATRRRRRLIAVAIGASAALMAGNVNYDSGGRACLIRRFAKLARFRKRFREDERGRAALRRRVATVRAFTHVCVCVPM